MDFPVGPHFVLERRGHEGVNEVVAKAELYVTLPESYLIIHKNAIINTTHIGQLLLDQRRRSVLKLKWLYLRKLVDHYWLQIQNLLDPSYSKDNFFFDEVSMDKPHHGAGGEPRLELLLELIKSVVLKNIEKFSLSLAFSKDDLWEKVKSLSISLDILNFFPLLPALFFGHIKHVLKFIWWNMLQSYQILNGLLDVL